jgi:hypothetical protein
MKRATPYLLAAAVLAAGFVGIHQTNVTWDEAVGDLFFGQRYFSFFTTFDARYLDFRADPYPPGYVPDVRASFLRIRPWEHYPVASTLATAASRLFMALHLLDPFDGYHAFNVLLAAAFLIVFYRFVEDGAERIAAIAATLLLFLAPRIAADTLSNVKDYAEMVFFSAALILLWRAVERDCLPLLFASGIVAGLALGTKANALFLPPIALAFTLWRGVSKRAVAFLAIWLAVMGLVFFASWPYLWNHPIDAIVRNAHYLLLRQTYIRPSDTAGPFAMIALTTPPVFLLAIAVGLVPLAQRLRRRDSFAILLACWIGVVALRLMAPASVNFDGVRHFLELFPPLAAVAGLGVASFGRWKALAAAVAVVPVAIALAFVHPFETTYWNVFAGGLDGAMRRQIPQASDYWAASYRVGLRWLDEHAPPNALLAVPIAEHTVRMVAPFRLRGDIHLVHLTNPWSPRIDQNALAALRQASAQRPVYVMFVFRRDWSNELMVESINRYPRVQVWQVDGAPVLAIFRMVPAPSLDRRP